MSDDTTSDPTNLAALKDKLFEEFEKMSGMLQKEKADFEQQMVRRKTELDLQIQNKLSELTADKKELEESKNELQQKGVFFSKEMEKRTGALERMKEEIEQEKKEFLEQIAAEQERAKSEEVIKLRDIELRSEEIEKENKELIKRKLVIENELKNLKKTCKKEEDLHFQKMAALKTELDKLEDEIEQKLFLSPGGTVPEYTKKSRELIIKMVTGETYRGNINIGSKERLSDMFTQVKIPFIVMYDVVFKGEKKTTVFINKGNIVSIKPLDDPGTGSSPAVTEKKE